MKANIGVDAESGRVHTVVGTSANVADVTPTAEVRLGEKKTVYLDAGYTGVERREDLKERDIFLSEEFLSQTMSFQSDVHLKSLVPDEISGQPRRIGNLKNWAAA